MLKLYPCDICKKTDFILYKEKQGFNGDITKIVKCKHCTLTVLNPRRNEKIEFLYENRKFRTLTGKHKNFRLSLFEFGMKLLSPKISKGTILDVAMNDGTFLNSLSPHRWKRFGIEDSKSAYEYCKENFDFKGAHTNVHECGFPNNYFDVISLWDVLNRAPIPSRNIHSINRILKDNGFLLISFEVPERVLFRGVNHYFTPYTFDKLLSKEGYKSVSFYYLEETSEGLTYQEVDLNENTLNKNKIGHYIAVYQKSQI